MLTEKRKSKHMRLLPPKIIEYIDEKGGEMNLWFARMTDTNRVLGSVPRQGIAPPFGG